MWDSHAVQPNGGGYGAWVWHTTPPAYSPMPAAYPPTPYPGSYGGGARRRAAELASQCSGSSVPGWACPLALGLCRKQLLGPCSCQTQGPGVRRASTEQPCL